MARGVHHRQGAGRSGLPRGLLRGRAGRYRLRWRQVVKYSSSFLSEMEPLQKERSESWARAWHPTSWGLLAAMPT